MTGDSASVTFFPSNPIYNFFKKYGRRSTFQQRLSFFYQYKQKHKHEIEQIRNLTNLNLENKSCGFMPSFVDFVIYAEYIDRKYEPLEDEINAIKIERVLKKPNNRILLNYQSSRIHTQFLPSDLSITCEGEEVEDSRAANMFDFYDMIEGSQKIPCAESLNLFENIANSLDIIYPTDFSIFERTKQIEKDDNALREIKKNSLPGVDVDAYLPVVIKAFGDGGKVYIYLMNHFCWDDNSLVQEFITPVENRFGINYDLQVDLKNSMNKALKGFRLLEVLHYGSDMEIKYFFSGDILSGIELRIKNRAEQYKQVIRNLKGKIDNIAEEQFNEASI